MTRQHLSRRSGFIRFDNVAVRLAAAFVFGWLLFDLLYVGVSGVIVPFLEGLADRPLNSVFEQNAILGTLNTRRFPLSAEFNGYVLQFEGFLTALIMIIVGSAAVVLFVAWLRRGEKRSAPGVVGRRCPECLSLIPAAARRCSYCQSQVEPQIAPQDTT